MPTTAVPLVSATGYCAWRLIAGQESQVQLLLRRTIAAARVGRVEESRDLLLPMLCVDGDNEMEDGG